MIRAVGYIVSYFLTLLTTLLALFQFDGVKEGALWQLISLAEERYSIALNIDSLKFRSLFQLDIEGIKISYKGRDPLFVSQAMLSLSLKELKPAFSFKEPKIAKISLDYLEGTVSFANGSLSIEGAYQDIPFRLDSSLETGRFLLLSDQFQLEGSLKQSEDEVSIEEASGLIENFPFEGSATINLEKELIDAHLHSIFKLPIKESHTPLQLNLHLFGPLASPEVALAIDEPLAKVGEFEFEKLHLELESFPMSRNAESSFKLHGQFDGHPLTIGGNLHIENGRLLRLEDLSLSLAGAFGSGHILFDLDERIIQSSLSLATDELEEEIDDGEWIFRGHLFSTLELTATLDESYAPIEPLIHFRFDSDHLELSHLVASDLSIAVDYEMGKKGHLSLSCDDLQHRGSSFRDLQLSAELFSKSASPFSFKAILGKGESILLEGWVEYDNDFYRGYFERGEYCFSEGTLKLANGAQLTYADEFLKIERLSLFLDESQLNVKGYLSLMDSNIQLSSPMIDLERFSSLLGTDLMGTLEGRFSLHGPWNQLQGEGLLEVSHLQPKGYPTDRLFPASGQLRCSVNNSHFLGSAELVGALEETINVNFRLPLKMEPFGVTFAKDQPLELQADVELEISPFLTFLLTDTTSLTGMGKVKLNMAGTLNRPLLYGVMEVREGHYESLDMGCIFQNMEGAVIMDGNRLFLSELVGYDSDGGQIRGTGQLLLDPTKNYPFEVTLDVTDAQLLNLDYAEALASGQLLFKGDTNRGKLNGKLSVSHAEIQLPDETPALLNTVEVEYINQSEEERPPTIFAKSEDEWPLDLDIKLNIQEPAKVSSTNLQSLWRGELDLKGTTDDPLIYGQGKIVEGNFRFNGKELNSHEGMIYFSGDPGRKTTLYIIAREEIDDLKIEVIVKGPIRSPELAFRSNPPKTTREILSYLIFNRGLSDISSLEGEELTQNIIKLNENQSEGPDILDKFKQSLGIDRIDITGTQGGDPDDVSLSVGKYITKRFLLSLRKSMSDHPNQASIEADLTHNFKAQAEIGDDAAGRMILKWEKDY